MSGHQVLVLAVGLASVLVTQRHYSLDLTEVQPGPAVGTTMGSCHGGSPHGTIPTVPLILTLGQMPLRSYSPGDRQVFEVTIESRGPADVVIPWRSISEFGPAGATGGACSTPS